MPRPYTYAGEYPTAHKYSTVYGISQGQKYIDDFRPTCEFKVQIRLKKFLVSKILLVCKDSTKTVEALIYKGFYGFVFEI